MTLQEKADQLIYTPPAIPRLDIPAYTWGDEALHGVARAGYLPGTYFLVTEGFL
jgi:beta-glucosidase